MIQVSDFLAPFSLLRMATLPYDSLNLLRLPQTEEAVHQLMKVEQEIQTSKHFLADVFFRLVSALGEDEVRLRRAALKLKRNVHNDKALTTPEEVVAELIARMSAQDAHAFERYLESVSQYAADLNEAKCIYSRELQHCLRANMRKPLFQPLFARALALASTGVANDAAKEHSLPDKANPTNFERSLFGYLLRAAAKTSPFSSFMAMTAVPVSAAITNQGLVGKQLTYQCRTRLNRGIPARLYKAIAMYLVKRNVIALSLNATFTQQGDSRFAALCERDMVLLGRPWSETRLASFRFQQRLADVFLHGNRQDNWSGWIRRVQQGGQIDEAKAAALVEKFVAKGILTLPPLTDSFDAQPELTLFHQLQRWASDLPPSLIDDLSRMIGYVEHLETDESRDRAASLEKIRSLEAQMLNSVGNVAHSRLHNAVLEDCWCSGFEQGINPNVLTDLQDLQAFLATQVSFLPEYLRLVELFVQRYGEMGECRDVAGFLTEVGDKLVELPEYGAQATQQVTRYAPPGAKLGVTAQIQLISDGNGSIPQIVVNRVFDRAAWLAARFAIGEEPEKAFLRDALSEWLETLSDGAEPVDLLINGHCNDLQTHPKLLKRTLSWPNMADEKPSADSLDIHALTLRHDKTSGLLTLWEGDTPINLVYLGSTFPTPSWGIKFALTILTQPYTLTRPSFKPPVLSGADPVIFNPRMTHGQVILSRAFWWVKCEYLRSEWFAHSDVKGLIEIERQLQQYQLPETFYVTPFSGDNSRGAISSDVLKGERKPLWVNTKNPFSLHLLKRLAEKHEWLSFTEALPGPEQLWLEVDGKKHVSELQLEMLVEANRN